MSLHNKLQVLGIDHIVLRTQNLNAMLAFYTQVLACPIERQLPKEVGLIQLRAGNALIDIVDVDSELGRIGGAAPSSQANNLDHFCLTLAEISTNELLTYLKAVGIEGEFIERYGATGFGPDGSP